MEAQDKMSNPEPQKPACPGGLDVKISNFTIEQGLTMSVCEKYERETKLIGFYPSPDFCPDCKYNPENVKRGRQS
jgi:hypothetical protein